MHRAGAKKLRWLTVICGGKTSTQEQMWNEQRKRFLSIVVMLPAIFTLGRANVQNSVEHLQFPQSLQEETVGHLHVMIEYISRLFCSNVNYRFNHIYVERSLSTGLADKLINRISQCMSAGVLVSRLSFDLVITIFSFITQFKREKNNSLESFNRT